MSQLQDIRRRHGARRSALPETMRDIHLLRREYRAALRDMATLLGLTYWGGKKVPAMLVS